MESRLLCSGKINRIQTRGVFLLHEVKRLIPLKHQDNISKTFSSSKKKSNLTVFTLWSVASEEFKLFYWRRESESKHIPILLLYIFWFLTLTKQDLVQKYAQNTVTENRYSYNNTGFSKQSWKLFILRYEMKYWINVRTELIIPHKYFYKGILTTHTCMPQK